MLCATGFGHDLPRQQTLCCWRPREDTLHSATEQRGGLWRPRVRSVARRASPATPPLSAPEQAQPALRGSCWECRGSWKELPEASGTGGAWQEGRAAALLRRRLQASRLSRTMPHDRGDWLAASEMAMVASQSGCMSATAVARLMRASCPDAMVAARVEPGAAARAAPTVGCGRARALLAVRRRNDATRPAGLTQGGAARGIGQPCRPARSLCEPAALGPARRGPPVGPGPRRPGAGGAARIGRSHYAAAAAQGGGLQRAHILGQWTPPSVLPLAPRAERAGPGGTAVGCGC